MNKDMFAPTDGSMRSIYQYPRKARLAEMMKDGCVLNHSDKTGWFYVTGKDDGTEMACNFIVGDEIIKELISDGFIRQDWNFTAKPKWADGDIAFTTWVMA